MLKDVSTVLQDYVFLQISERFPRCVALNQTLWWHVRRERYPSVFYLEQSTCKASARAEGNDDINCWLDSYQSIFSMNNPALFSTCNASFRSKRKKDSTQQMMTRSWQAVQSELEWALNASFCLWTPLDLSIPFQALCATKCYFQDFIVKPTGCWETQSVQDLPVKKNYQN